MKLMTFSATKRMFAAALLVAPGLVMTNSAAQAAAPSQEELQAFCERTSFTRGEIRRLQRSRYFDDILEYTLEYCPYVTAALTSIPTATIEDEPDEKRDDRVRPQPTGGGGEEPEGEEEPEDEEEREDEGEREGEEEREGEREAVQ